MQKIIELYFDFWNKKDLDGLGSLFSHHVRLTDWTDTYVGKTAVLALNRNIFINSPAANIYVDDYAMSAGGKIMAQITVCLSATNQLRVVDVFSLDKDLITEIIAYKV